VRLKPFAVVIALLLGLVGATSETATAAGGGAWTYDVLTLSRFDVRAGGGADSGSAQFTGVRDRSASASVEAIGRSTTFSPRSVATEAAAGGEQLALGSGRFTNAEFAPGELEAHFAKHAGEWGAIGEDSYLARARSMLSSDPGGDLLGSVRANGDVLRFNVRTGEFAVGSSDGVIRTLFRPDAGLDYWLAQVGK